MPTPSTLTAWIETLATGVVDTQEQLDAHVDACLATLHGHLDEFPAMLLEVVMPPVLRVRETTIELQFEVAHTITREGFQLRGRPRTAFSRARFPAATSSEAVLIRFEVRALPPVPGDAT
jgi:hypothetical protein